MALSKKQQKFADELDAKYGLFADIQAVHLLNRLGNYGDLSKKLIDIKATILGFTATVLEREMKI